MTRGEGGEGWSEAESHFVWQGVWGSNKKYFSFSFKECQLSFFIISRAIVSLHGHNMRGGLAKKYFFVILWAIGVR